MPDDQSWREHAACRDKDVDLFFPVNGEDVKYAQAVCRDCPVQHECLEYGIREDHGVWGGASERRRRRIRKDAGITLRHNTLDDILFTAPPEPETAA